jgi:PAS domain S-box-containing protein
VSQQKYRTILDSIDQGFCVIEVLFDDADNAMDFRFLEVNRVFEKQTGIANATGRWIREILPALEEHWFQTYGQIALTGEPRRFENPAHALGRSYDVYAFRVGRPEQRHVAILFNDITERKRAEEALRGTRELNQAVLGSLAANIAVLDREGHIIAVNEAWKRFAYENDGAAVADCVGVNYLQVCRDAQESGDGGWEALNGIQAVLDGTLHNFVLEYPCHSPGEKRWFLMSATPLPSERGGVVVTHTDITARQRIEEELKAANMFLDAVIENIPLMLFIKESQSLRFIRVNRTGEDLLGWPNQTLIGKTAYDFWPKEQAEFFIEKDRETLTNGSVVDIPEEPIQTRHHGVRILHTKKVPILDTAGNPAYLLGISEDITERKRIEQEQQFLAEVSVALSTSLEYEQTLANLARLVVQSVADWSAVDVMDEEGRLSRLKVASADPNQAALCAVLEQMPPDRDLPHLMRSVIESRRPIVVEQVTSQYLESLGQGPEHLQALLATGLTSFVAVPLLMRGQPLGALFLGSSTPSRVFRQGDLRWAEALADRAAMAIENARLYRSSMHATQLRDQVLGVVAHDLRNPLSAIQLQSSTLRYFGPESERHIEEVREAIHRAVTRMNRLIQDLLDIALMEAGQLTIERARLSSGDLVVEAVDIQRGLASSSSLEIRVGVGSNLPAVWGDRDRLLQVFENLIGNAIKFTKPGGSITVGAAPRDREVVFWVGDTGDGIEPENLPRIFDRFWQATKTGRQGAGLGLPITKGIVEAHGGHIWVESTAGSGSTFFFAIPGVSAAEKRRSESPST